MYINLQTIIKMTVLKDCHIISQAIFIYGLDLTL